MFPEDPNDPPNSLQTFEQDILSGLYPGVDQPDPEPFPEPEPEPEPFPDPPEDQ